MKKLTTLILSFCALVVFAQDEIILNQNYSSPLSVNPAFAGSAGRTRVAVNYFNQYPGTGSTNVKSSVSADHYFGKIKGGIGIIASSFVAEDGVYNFGSYSLIYSAHIPLAEKLVIKPAIQLGFGNKKIMTEFCFPPPPNPSLKPIFLEQFGYSKIRFIDVSAGFIIYNEKYFGGAMVYHIAEPYMYTEKSIEETTDSYVLPMRYDIHGGLNLFTESKIQITPTARIVITDRMELYRVICAAALKGYRMGLGYERSGIMDYDNYHLLLGFVGKKFSIVYNYVFFVSQLNNQHLGSHEFSFTWLFGKKDKTPEITCPVINGI